LSDAHKAKLAFVSEPNRGLFLLNLQFENGANLCVELSAHQLRNIIADGARMTLATRLEPGAAA